MQPGGQTLNEPVNNPPADRSGTAETASTTPRRPAFSRVLLVLAAPVLPPVLFAVVLTLLFNPVYAWVKRGGILVLFSLRGSH